MPSKIPTFKPKGLRAAPTRRDSPEQKAIHSRTWRKLREIFLRDWVQQHGPYCADCGAALRFDRTTHVDHIERHAGINDPRFSDPANVAVRCSACHASKTRREEHP